MKMKRPGQGMEGKEDRGHINKIKDMNKKMKQIRFEKKNVDK